MSLKLLLHLLAEINNKLKFSQVKENLSCQVQFAKQMHEACVLNLCLGS